MANNTELKRELPTKGFSFDPAKQAGIGFADPSGSGHPHTTPQSGPEEPVLGTDGAIQLKAWDLLQGASGNLPGESLDFDVEVASGVVKVTGSTWSTYVYQRVQDVVPKLKAIEGVTSVDISAVRKL